MNEYTNYFDSVSVDGQVHERLLNHLHNKPKNSYRSEHRYRVRLKPVVIFAILAVVLGATATAATLHLSGTFVRENENLWSLVSPVEILPMSTAFREFVDDEANYIEGRLSDDYLHGGYNYLKHFNSLTEAEEFFEISILDNRFFNYGAKFVNAFIFHESDYSGVVYLLSGFDDLTLQVHFSYGEPGEVEHQFGFFYNTVGEALFINPVDLIEPYNSSNNGLNVQISPGNTVFTNNNLVYYIDLIQPYTDPETGFIDSEATSNAFRRIVDAFVLD